MWAEKVCTLDMFMTFYEMYHRPCGSYRDFLRDVLTVYESVIKNKINEKELSTRPGPENEQEDMLDSKEEQEVMNACSSDLCAAEVNSTASADIAGWPPQPDPMATPELTEPPAPPHDLAALRTHLNGAAAQPCSLLERAIFSQFASASASSSSSTIPLSASASAAIPSCCEQPPPPPLPLPMKVDVYRNEADEDEDEDEDEELEKSHDPSLPSLSSCQVCGWSCASPSLLLHHALRHAPNEARPHVCLECGRRFKRRDGLNRHLNIHRDLRPFPCPHCGQAFRLKQHLSRHLEARHSAGFSVSMAPPGGFRLKTEAS